MSCGESEWWDSAASFRGHNVWREVSLVPLVSTWSQLAGVHRGCRRSVGLLDHSSKQPMGSPPETIADLPLLPSFYALCSSFFILSGLLKFQRQPRPGSLFLTSGHHSCSGRQPREGVQFAGGGWRLPPLSRGLLSPSASSTVSSLCRLRGWAAVLAQC